MEIEKGGLFPVILPLDTLSRGSNWDLGVNTHNVRGKEDASRKRREAASDKFISKLGMKVIIGRNEVSKDSWRLTSCRYQR